MNERQQRQIDEAAQKFAEAVRESFQAVAERSVLAQQLNAELTQSFFNSVIENLRSQTEGSRAMTEELIGQQERQRDAAQMMARESVDVYMDFINSMFSYYQGSMEQAQRRTGTQR